MNLTIHQMHSATLLLKRNAWRKAALVLSLTTLLLGVALVQKREKVILVPPQLHKSFWVQGDEMSREYLEEMGLYMARLLLDLSPELLTHNHKVLLRYATPEAYGKLKRQFLKEEADYKGLQLSTHFKPSSVLANPKTLTVKVAGTLTSYVASKEIKTSSETLLLTFTTRGSGLLLRRATMIEQEPPQ